jgi:long-subunit fatty acid transport protein
VPVRRALTVLALGLLALLAGQQALASDNAKLDAYGVRAAGRGGVDYAIADDATAGATNPAGLAFIGNRIDQTWGLFDAHSTFAIQGNPTKDNVPRLIFPYPAYSFGVVFDPSAPWRTSEVFDFGNWGLKKDSSTAPAPAPGAAKDPPDDKTAPTTTKAPKAPKPPREPTDEELYGSPFRIGLGIYPVTGGTFKYTSVRSPLFPQGVEYKTVSQMLSVSPLLAYRFSSNFSVGFTPQLIYSTFKIKGPVSQPISILSPNFLLASSILSPDPNVVTYADSFNLSTFGFSYKLGAMFNSEMFSLGVIYQERTFLQDHLGSAKVDGTNAVNRLTNNNPGQTGVLGVDPSKGFVSQYDMRVKLQFPRYAGAGIAVRPIPRLTLAFDYTFMEWSELFKNFEARISNAGNKNLEIMTSPSVHISVPLNYRDSHIFAFGISMLLFQGDDIVPGVPEYAFVLRMGYNYGTNPQPDNTVLPQTPTFYAHHASAGFSFQWGPHWELSFAIERAFQNTIRVTNHVADPDLSNSKQTTELMSYYAGFGVNF